MTNVQLYTKRTTIYDSVQLYIVYVYRVYLYTQSINIQRLHETSFVSLLSFFSNENKKNPVAVAGAGSASGRGISSPWGFTINRPIFCGGKL